MPKLLHEFVIESAARTPDAPAISHRGLKLSYGDLAEAMFAMASGMTALGIVKGDRVAIYLPKQAEAIIAMFATTAIGGIFVPINPLLKPPQVQHILADCRARVLVTSIGRAKYLQDSLKPISRLETMVITDYNEQFSKNVAPGPVKISWETVYYAGAMAATNRMSTIQPRDLAAILYTSGSTGKPIGVALSHGNMVTGAISVASYLHNTEQDRILAVLPFSFDYGLSQLTTSTYIGACIVLMEYLSPQDVLNIIEREKITGLAATPSLWIKLSQLKLNDSVAATLRYITNSGGALPKDTLKRLQAFLPEVDIYLMYGLTEAFRSTFLSPDQLNSHTGSIGKAIPNAEVLVLRPADGKPCKSHEHGELVHTGPLVAQGYWNNKTKTKKRFKALDGSNEPAVWSGDIVYFDDEGYLYFVGRNDDLIKTSGYRVSPTEVEEVLYSSELIKEVVVFGVPHPVLGQAIVAVIVPNSEAVWSGLQN